MTDPTSGQPLPEYSPEAERTFAKALDDNPVLWAVLGSLKQQIFAQWRASSPVGEQSLATREFCHAAMRTLDDVEGSLRAVINKAVENAAEEE